MPDPETEQPQAGQEPPAPPAPPPPTSTSAPASPPEAPPPASTDPDPPTAPDVEDDEDDADVELTAAELEQELNKVRRQAAKYRTERKQALGRITELEATISQLQEQSHLHQPNPAAEAEARAATAERRAIRLEAAADAGIALPLLRSLDELAAASDLESLRSAFAAVQTYLSTMSSHDPSPRANPAPPSMPSRPLTIDEQISAAEKSGDWKTAMRLKSAKAHTRSGKK